MPRYHYKCKKCSHEFTTVHMMSERLTDCKECEVEGALIRVPSLSSRPVSKPASKPGAVVKQYLKDAKKEIEHEKKELRTKEIK